MKNDIFNLISRMVGQNNILTLNVILIDYTGSHTTALMLSQLLYWYSRSIMDGWVAKKYSEWYEEIRLTEKQARKSKNDLEKLGIIETKFKKFNGIPTIHYRVKKDVFERSIITFCQGGPLPKVRVDPYLKAVSSITDTTTDITTETTTRREEPANTLVPVKKSQSFTKWAIDLFYNLFRETFNEKYIVEGGRDGKRLKKLEGFPRPEIETSMKAFISSSNTWLQEHMNIPGFVANYQRPELMEARRALKAGQNKGTGIYLDPRVQAVKDDMEKEAQELTHA